MPMRTLKISQRERGVLGSEGSEALAFGYWEKELGWHPDNRRFRFGFCVIVTYSLFGVLRTLFCTIFPGGSLYSKLEIPKALIQS